MEFKGKYSVPASPNEVWDALHDPRILAAAIPGCEAVEKISDTEYKARAVVRIGPLKARFQGKVHLQELTPQAGVARSMILKGEGQGGAAGFARGQSEVRLSPDGQGTVLEYSANVTVGGRLAQVGQRLIDGAAKMLADEFFAKFTAQMHARVGSQGGPRADAIPKADAVGEQGLEPQIWVVGLIGIIVILLIVFSMVL